MTPSLPPTLSYRSHPMSLRPLLALALVACVTALPAADPHAGHDHSHGHSHGPLTPIGKAVMGTYSVTVEAAGNPAPGKEWHLEILLDPAQPAPKAVRVWVGQQNARGSVKSKAAPKMGPKGAYSAHVDVPAPLPAGSQVWIALEPNAGEATQGSLALPKAGHQHGAGEPHQH